MKKFIRIISLFVLSFIISDCSSSSDDTFNNNIPNTDMIIVLDGVSLTVTDVQATYDSDNDVVEFNAMLSDGHKIWTRYSYKKMAYMRIANPDGSDSYSNIKHFRGQYFTFDKGFVNTEDLTSTAEFSGKLFADDTDLVSPSKYIVGFTKVHYTPFANGINNVTASWYYSGNVVFKPISWVQNSPSGSPIQLTFEDDGKAKFQLFFDAVPVVGYYQYNPSSSNKIVFTKYDFETQQERIYDCSGILHISEVSQTPKRIKGEFNFTGTESVYNTNFNINNCTFDCSYN